MTALTELGVAAIRDGVKAGEFTAREVAEAWLAAVEKGRPLNAYVVETPDHALAAADAADADRAAGPTRPGHGPERAVAEVLVQDVRQVLRGAAARQVQVDVPVVVEVADRRAHALDGHVQVRTRGFVDESAGVIGQQRRPRGPVAIPEARCLQPRDRRRRIDLQIGLAENPACEGATDPGTTNARSVKWRPLSGISRTVRSEMT